MDYKITQFDPARGQIAVEFLLIPGYVVAIDLPVDDAGNLPVADALDSYIKGFLPYSEYARQQALANGITNVGQFIESIGSSTVVVTGDSSGDLSGLENL